MPVLSRAEMICVKRLMSAWGAVMRMELPASLVFILAPGGIRVKGPSQPGSDSDCEPE